MKNIKNNKSKLGNLKHPLQNAFAITPGTAGNGKRRHFFYSP